MNLIDNNKYKYLHDEYHSIYFDGCLFRVGFHRQVAMKKVCLSKEAKGLTKALTADPQVLVSTGRSRPLTDLQKDQNIFTTEDTEDTEENILLNIKTTSLGRGRGSRLLP